MNEHLYEIDRLLRARGLRTRVYEHKGQIRVKDANLTITVVHRGQYFVSILNKLGYDQVFRRKTEEELVRLSLARKAVLLNQQRTKNAVN